jgi:subtilisin family serine protease
VLVMVRLQPAHARPNSDYAGGYGGSVEQAERRHIAERLARRYGLMLEQNWPMPLVGVDCFVMDVPEDRSPADVAERLSREPDVAWSEPMNLYHAQESGPSPSSATPSHNDPLYQAQPAAREWRLAALHRYSTGRNVRIAVIDSMVDTAHPDLAGQVELSRNFVSGRPAAGGERHGTGVAGVIAARADNGIGIAGVAPGAKLLALRACWQRAADPNGALCDSLGLAKALDFAISHDAQIINLSLSGPSDTLLAKLLDAAEARRITVVGAVDRQAPGGGFPASHKGVLAVADESQGPGPPGAYLAPGRDVPTTTPGGRWGLVNGSSFAAAHVSGLVALLRQRTPADENVKLVLASSGSGAIDVCASVLHWTASCDCGCARLAGSAASGQR